MKTRISKKLKTNITESQFCVAVAMYGFAEHREEEINKAIEDEVTELIDKYEDELISLAQTKNKNFDMARSYCISNKETLFGKRRRVSTGNGIAGFRLGTPRLKVLKGTNWNNVLTALKEKLPGYVRTCEEPAKDQLLADRNKEQVAAMLEEIGVQVVQDELFYIERTHPAPQMQKAA